VTGCEFTFIESYRFDPELAVESKASVRQTISVDVDDWGTQAVWAGSLKVSETELTDCYSLLLLELMSIKSRWCGKFVPVTVMLSPPSKLRLESGVAEAIVQATWTFVTVEAFGIRPSLETISTA